MADTLKGGAALQFARFNPMAWLRVMADNDLAILTTNDVPTSGAAGTGFNKAGKGCLLIDILHGTLYQNTNTKASPTWTLIEAAGLIPLANGDFFVGNAGGIATAVAPSGDVTFDNTGAFTIGASKVLTTNIAALAVTTAKIALLAVTDALLDPGTIKTATLAITNAQAKNLRATPLTVVAAPGAGKMILPISASIELVYGGTNAFTSAANDVLGLKWKDGTTSSLMTGFVQALAQATASSFGVFLGLTASNVSKANTDNQALVVHNITASELAGNAAADNTLNLVVKYTVQPTV